MHVLWIQPSSRSNSKFANRKLRHQTNAEWLKILQKTLSFFIYATKACVLFANFVPWTLYVKRNCAAFSFQWFLIPGAFLMERQSGFYFFSALLRLGKNIVCLKHVRKCVFNGLKHCTENFKLSTARNSPTYLSLNHCLQLDHRILK